MANAELRGAEALPADEARQVVDERPHVRARLAQPERRLDDGDDAGRGHSLVVVRGSRAHVDVRIDESHGDLRVLVLRCPQPRAAPRPDLNRRRRLPGRVQLEQARRAGIGCLAQRKGGRLLLVGCAALEQAREVLEHRTCRERADTAPQFRTDGPRCRPPFVRVVAEHSGQGRVAPRVQTDNRGQRAADEQRLQHQLIPRRLGELLRRIGIAVRHGLEDHPHVRPNALRRPQRVTRLVGVQRQAAIERDELPDVGGAAQPVEPRAHPRAVRRCSHKAGTRAPPGPASSRGDPNPGGLPTRPASSASVSASGSLPTCRETTLISR